MTPTKTDYSYQLAVQAGYYRALNAAEAIRLRKTIFDALKDYVSYFESHGLLWISPAWLRKTFEAATYPTWDQSLKEPPTNKLTEAQEIVDAVYGILLDGNSEARTALIQLTTGAAMPMEDV
jgi:hypothetical protein